MIDRSWLRIQPDGTQRAAIGADRLWRRSGGLFRVHIPEVLTEGAVASAPPRRYTSSVQLSGAELAIGDYDALQADHKAARSLHPCFSPTDMAIIQSYKYSEANGPV
ncbi:hypothetical protein CBM2634_U100001 [Cupriavidus taiwanensis]|uniref:Uncharacterized protein n=1 Tax=Cupriavidus taiwanensis TaxID=164546 RepID=A0A375JBH2_9BURK|nr:hypothetical protein CBM2634_U100001 [Cupriavidus taiwanensis]